MHLDIDGHDYQIYAIAEGYGSRSKRKARKMPCWFVDLKKNTMWTLVLYCHPPKIDRTPNNFKILMISMICRLRVVEFILSRLPDDVIFGSAKDLVPTAQMMYNSSEQICGCFHFFFEPCLSQWQWVWKWVFCHNLWPFSEDGNFGKSLNRVSFR